MLFPFLPKALVLSLSGDIIDRSEREVITFPLFLAEENVRITKKGAVSDPKRMLLIKHVEICFNDCVTERSVQTAAD